MRTDPMAPRAHHHRSRPPRSGLAKASLSVFVPFLAAALQALTGCGRAEIKPVDLFPEDLCAHCRMTVSDAHCASEIVLESGEVFKFDDLQCMETYRADHPGLTVAAVFVKDYDTRAWLKIDQAVMVTTGIFTPMGSGRVAFRDSARAQEFQRRYPRNERP